MVKITKVFGRQILDSRGVPTVEVDVLLDDGSFGRAAVPSGASTGQYEAHELRDGGKEYFGKGVLKAVSKVREIEKKIKGLKAEQRQIDELMIQLDGTENKERLGANAILGVSLAVAKAAAASQRVKLYEYIRNLAGEKSRYILPVPMINIWNGGSHASWSTDIQEYMIIPFARTYSEGIMMAATVFHNLKGLLKKNGFATTVGDEGGFAPLDVKSNAEPLEWIEKAIEISGYKIGKDIAMAIDSAASSFFENNKYFFKKQNKKLSASELINFYSDIKKRFQIVSIEDGLAEDDWSGWSELTRKLGKNTQIVGDDLYTTNIKRLRKGIELNASNSVLIKLNQIGTLTETIDCINMAKKAGFSAIVSHRSGETEDTTISHLAVGCSTGQIKTGSVCRGERICKYNELLRIEEEVNGYLGKRIFRF